MNLRSLAYAPASKQSRLRNESIKVKNSVALRMESYITPYGIGANDELTVV